MPLGEVDPEETCALALVADPLVWITEHLRERVQTFKTTATALFLERRRWRIETPLQELTSKNVDPRGWSSSEETLAIPS